MKCLRGPTGFLGVPRKIQLPNIGHALQDSPAKSQPCFLAPSDPTEGAASASGAVFKTDTGSESEQAERPSGWC